MNIFIIILTVVIHLVIPGLFLYLIAAGEVEDRLSWIGSTAVFVSFLSFLHLAGGGWHWVGWYWPYLFWVLGAVAVGWFLWRRWGPLGWWPSKHWKSWVSVVISALLTVFFVTGVVGALQGQSAPDEPVQLEFPLDDGLYYIGHGGATETVNHHVPVGAQRYAIDVVQLGGVGVRARGLWPEDVTAYRIWGAMVYAPCDGRVVAMESQLEDQPVPQTDPSNPAGNHVAIHCEESDVTMVLAHLQEGLAWDPDDAGELQIGLGTEVRSGDPVGRVGNSGNTTEPHLHVHAVEGRVTEPRQLLSEARSVPMEFDARFLTRTDRVDRR